MFDIYSAARAFGEPPVRGRLRATPKDFQVVEIPAFTPSGEGEHVILTVRKTNKNTQQVGKMIAQLAGLPQSKVSWAGLKDRQAVTEQWFSVHMGNTEEPDWHELDSDDIKVLEVYRHRKKLRRGVLKGNQFFIRVTDIEGDLNELKARYESILDYGVPNYFGEQRFGFRGGNIAKALTMFRNPKRRIKRHEKGLYLSAARSLIFNAVLSKRVEDKSWDKHLDGDVFQLNGRSSIFNDDGAEDLSKRLENFEINPTGPLWGRGQLMSTDRCGDLETAVSNEHEELCAGINRFGSSQDRRSLRVEPKFFQMQTEQNTISLSFELPAGSYATSVIRELVDIT